MTNSSSMPQFTFPSPQPSSYNYNEGDSVNVTWTWDAPPEDATVELVYWIQQWNKTDAYISITDSSFLSPIGYRMQTLDYQNPDLVQLPSLSHFQLVAHFANGSQIKGSNSKGITLKNRGGLGPVCQNCVTVAAPAPAPATTPAVASQSQSSTLSAGAIAGIAVGPVAAVIAVAALYIFLRKRNLRRRRKATMTKTDPLNGLSTDADVTKADPTTSANKSGHVPEMDTISPNPELPAPVFFEIGTNKN